VQDEQPGEDHAAGEQARQARRARQRYAHATGHERHAGEPGPEPRAGNPRRHERRHEVDVDEVLDAAQREKCAETPGPDRRAPSRNKQQAAAHREHLAGHRPAARPRCVANGHRHRQDQQRREQHDRQQSRHPLFPIANDERGAADHQPCTSNSRQDRTGGYDVRPPRKDPRHEVEIQQMEDAKAEKGDAQRQAAGSSKAHGGSLGPGDAKT
jgi:hypothetical protein